LRVGILLLLAVMALGMGGALAAISITNTLSPSYGTIDYSIVSDGTKTGNYVITENQGDSNTLVKVEGVNVYGASSFIGSISAETNYGDYADTSVDFSGSSDVKVDNFNLYGYLTPNLAWTGQYTGDVEADYIDFFGCASTNGISSEKGYQYTNFNYMTEGVFIPAYVGTNDGPDFTASQVYTTSQAGGSYDNTEYDVGTQNTWGGEGTYAMSNVESGSFGINPSDRSANEYWNLYTEAFATDFQGNYIMTSDSPIQPGVASDDGLFGVTFGEGPLTFTVNTPAMNYADADIVYSKMDFGVNGYAGSYTDQHAYAQWHYYFPYISQNSNKNAGQDNIPLSSFENVFTYGYINAPQNIVMADVIYY
jgi:hypothetical protein